MVHSLVADEEHQVWKVAANMFYKQSKASGKGCSSSLGAGWELTTPCLKNQHVMKCYTGTQPWDNSLE
jgi:hypothetical protein